MALAQKLDGGVAVIFAATEAEGPNATFGFRQDNNFFYLSGLTEPGAALVVAPAFNKNSSQPYTEILFLPARNLKQEKWTGPKLGPDDPQAPADHRLRSRRQSRHAVRGGRQAARCRPSGHLPRYAGER